MRTLTAIGLGMVCLLLACDDDNGTGTLIGASCDNSGMCGPAGICITSGKNGECAIACSVSGGVGECPLGTYCDEEELASDFEPKQSMTVCLPACESDGDCRNGYKCKGVSAGPGKVCAPR